MYVYRYRFDEIGGQIEVAVYDPERWKDADPALRGGPKFGFGAEVLVYSRVFEKDFKAEVTMGAIGAHSPDDAVERAKVYLAAAALATRINDLLSAGKSIGEIGAWVAAGYPNGTPTDLIDDPEAALDL